MIIGISGKIKSGKNLTGQIIQYLILEYEQHGQIVNNFDINKNYNESSKWEQKAFAGKLKQIVALLTGCTVEDLESQEFKNKQLPAEWNHVYKWLNGSTAILGNLPVNVDTYKDDEIFKGNPERFIHRYTYRDLLQKIGTESMRDIIHENVWVNSLFADYKILNEDLIVAKARRSPSKWLDAEYPNWIITDLRFPNELNAVEDRGGITIRVDRDLPCKVCQLTLADRRGNQCKEIRCPLGTKEHLSETALDSVPFKYRINNDGTIEELVEKVREILIKEKII